MTALTSEQADILRAIADGKVIQGHIRNQWADLSTTTALNYMSAHVARKALSSNPLDGVRIKPESEIVRYRVCVMVMSMPNAPRPRIAWDQEDEATYVADPGFLGWAGPWQSVDVSTLMKDGP